MSQQRGHAFKNVEIPPKYPMSKDTTPYYLTNTTRRKYTKSRVQDFVYTRNTSHVSESDKFQGQDGFAEWWFLPFRVKGIFIYVLINNRPSPPSLHYLQVRNFSDIWHYVKPNDNWIQIQTFSKFKISYTTCARPPFIGCPIHTRTCSV